MITIAAFIERPTRQLTGRGERSEAVRSTERLASLEGSDRVGAALHGCSPTSFFSGLRQRGGAQIYKTSLLALFLLCLPAIMLAQLDFNMEVVAKITNSGQMYTTYNLSAPNVIEQLEDQFNKSQLAYVIANGTESAWPEGINSLAGWQKNKEKYSKFRAYEIGTFTSDGQSFGLLLIPAEKNKHMQYDMVPKKDIIFVIGLDGYLVKRYSENDFYSPSLRAGSSSTYDEDDFESDPEDAYASLSADSELGSLVEIIDPGELYSTYELEDNADAVALIKSTFGEDSGLIYTVSKESAWPPAISTLDARNARPSPLTKYKLYYLGGFGDLAILGAIGSETQDLPANFRSETDLVFVFNKKGFKILANTAPTATTPKVVESEKPVFTPLDLTGFAAENTFEGQLQRVAASYPQNFAPILGNRTPQDVEIMAVYESNVTLTGTKRTQISVLESTMGLYSAHFIEGSSYATAKSMFQALQTKVDKVKYPFMTLKSTEEPKEGKKETIKWLVSSTGNPDFQEFEMHLTLDEDVSFDVDETFSVTLTIYYIGF